MSTVPNVKTRTKSGLVPARGVSAVQNPLRRSARGWQPSAAALQGIANSSAQTIEEVDALFEDHIVQQGTSYAFSMHEEGVPYSFKNIQTFSPLEREKWMAACREESASHLAIPSISGALAPEEWTKAAPIRLTWVFARKPTGDYKARIVMLGQHMQAGVHFNDTHAPVPAATIVRLLLAITAAEGREFTQLDVKTAFLTAPMDIELDVILPEGFGTGQDNHLYDSFSARRRRALTAIPGCPKVRVWREKLVGDLGSLGFKTFLPTEPCLFKDDQSGEDPIFLVVWVDDIFVFSPSGPHGRARKQVFVQGMERLFPHGLKVTAAGTRLYHCLGLVVERPSARVIRITSSRTLNKFSRRRFKDGPGKPDDVPVSPSARLTKADCQERPQGDVTHAWYRSVLMSLNFAANWTRPDLAYLVSKGAKYMQAPGEVHVRFVKKGLRYLRGKLDLGLVYDFSRVPLRHGLYGFFDASHADDLDTRRSTIAYVFFYSGCAISWKTKLHSFVTTSTNHSELVASAMAAREAKYIWSVLGALGKPGNADLFTHRALDLFSDSMGVVAVAANDVLSSATKHVDIADFYVRELVQSGIVTVSYIKTTYMLADVLTKALGPEKFFHFIGILMGILREESLQRTSADRPHARTSLGILRDGRTASQATIERTIAEKESPGPSREGRATGHAQMRTIAMKNSLGTPRDGRTTSQATIERTIAEKGILGPIREGRTKSLGACRKGKPGDYS